MLLELLPYLSVLMIGALAAVLLTSKAVSERLVAAGILPRVFLGLVPMIQKIMRVFGITLIAAGLLGVAMQSGWINREYLARYGFPCAVLLLGLLVTILSARKQ